MTELDMQKMKYELRSLFNSLNIHVLRIFGREIGVPRATAIPSKDELMQKIIAVLTGDLTPSKQSKRGAPIKNNFLDPKVKKTV